MICAYKLFVVAGVVDGWRIGLLVIPGACLLFLCKKPCYMVANFETLPVLMYCVSQEKQFNHFLRAFVTN